MLSHPLGLCVLEKTGHSAPFTNEWKNAIAIVVKTFREQQKKGDKGPCSFQRNTAKATDTVPLQGYGYPVKPVGLICSTFRPSDDATVFSFLIPSNFFAVASLRQAAEMVQAIHKDTKRARACSQLADEVNVAVKIHATAQHPKFGNVYAFETDGFGNHLFMDGANVTSLLPLQYLGCISETDTFYLNTRKLILSESDPFFFKGKAAEGVGGPHAAVDMTWPLSIIMRGLTSSSDLEIKNCIDTL